MSAPSSTKPWKESFEVYFRWSTQGPQTVEIDLGASPHAPMASHPVLWRLTLPLKNPMSNGLRDSDEADPVFDVGVARTRDPGWTEYLRTLFPSALQYQSRMNRQRVALLRTEGDLLEVARRVEHRAHFPWEHQAKDAEARLRDLGFEGLQCQLLAVPGLMCRLDFHRVDTVDEARVDAVSEEILDIVEAHGGTYDGWGCLLLTEHP
ncbi:ribonuclease E inhibitor RraB [Corallococcus exercitus]|uniref:Ribonuclease E inhibitor RraB n=1 Tax=Corallococcus exercitus TaxID=2316736 RepID=A0A7Y4NWG1_9BACT|nr:ribonuclease E inhibitor RraB [Corallococcus exercitus]NOK38363.1 ribonuclease E inhibitor RraB [Corallococcus exercitus]